MKLKLLFLSFFLIPILSAQTFTEVSLPSDFGTIGGTLAFSDVDGDNDPDVLVTGLNNSFDLFAKLYRNDGQGNFSEVTETSFIGVGSNNSIAFSDVDGDNDPDVLITGSVGLDNSVAKLYINDGQGNFSEMLGTPFDGVIESSIAFSDVDGDNDPDVLITGRTDFMGNISKLYTNDGQGNFSEVTEIPFEGVRNSTVAFSDVDGDNDPDVLITGENSVQITKLYINDGLGNFSEMSGTPFLNVSLGSIAFSDVDNDSDPDVLITGITNSGEYIAELYINDGQGNFSEVTGTPFEGVVGGSIAFSDVDGDNDSDVLISGSLNGSSIITKLYNNDGLGNFTEVAGTPFDGVWFGSVAFSDVDGDNDPDVLISGTNNTGYLSKLYLNDLMVSSTDVEFSEFNSNIIICPNPAASSDLKVNFNSTENGFAVIKIYNLKGQLLSQQRETTLVGSQTILVDISRLSAGNYFIQMDNKKGTKVARFIVP